MTDDRLQHPMIIPDAALPYLQAQRGALDDMRGDADTWVRKYCNVLEAEFASIEPYLPADCQSILDVGGGMGGIDVLLNAYYGGGCDITLLDGLADPPAMRLHRKTFSHFGTARQFLAINGVNPNKIHAIDADNLPAISPRYFDLVVSFKSWCFHYPPAAYLDLVRSGCQAGARIIVDIRSEKILEYMRDMTRAFSYRGLVFGGAKFQTHLFEAL